MCGSIAACDSLGILLVQLAAGRRQKKTLSEVGRARPQVGPYRPTAQLAHAWASGYCSHMADQASVWHKSLTIQLFAGHCNVSCDAHFASAGLGMLHGKHVLQILVSVANG